jgi:hypothetical protein
MNEFLDVNICVTQKHLDEMVQISYNLIVSYEFKFNFENVAASEYA